MGSCSRKRSLRCRAFSCWERECRRASSCRRGEVDVREGAPEDRGAAPGGEGLSPEAHPQRPVLPPQQAEVMARRPALPPGVQQGLEQGRPVRRLHQSGKGVGPRVQYKALLPLGQLTEPAVAGQASHALPAQLQVGAGRLLRQGRGGLAGGGGGLQQAARHAVHHLVAGDIQPSPCGGQQGKGGGGAGEGHRLQGRELPGGPWGGQLGEAAALGLRRRQLQQGRRRGVEKTACHVHQLPAAVGDHLRQQKGNGAVPEGAGELVQMLCQGPDLLLFDAFFGASYYSGRDACWQRRDGENL